MSASVTLPPPFSNQLHTTARLLIIFTVSLVMPVLSGQRVGFREFLVTFEKKKKILLLSASKLALMGESLRKLDRYVFL